MPITAIIASTKSPIQTCRKSNAADGTGWSIVPPQARKMQVTQYCQLKMKEL
jgi:hypothetical protein